VKDNKILIKSWNKKLSGNPYCVGDSCYREENNLSGGAEIQKVCSIHAEAYAIAHAAKEGISIKNSTMYVSTHPCIICTRSIVVAGISKVVYMSDYESDQIFTSLYEENNIELIKISENEVWGNQ
jgi:dCMP deaminase